MEREVEVEGLHQLSAGMSWLNYGFTLVQDPRETTLMRHDMVLRLAPKVGILPPYQARAEFDLISALHVKGLPVPNALFYSDDPDDLGAPFQVFVKSEGKPCPMPFSISTADVALLPRWADEFIHILARLHNLDYRIAPSANASLDLTITNVAARQANHWHCIAERIMLRPLPLVSYAYHWLLENAPVASKLSIVHGDYRIGNFLARDGIEAILDWELAHVGDPHEDLSWSLLPSFNAGTEKLFAIVPRAQMFKRYQDLTGIEVRLESIDYYRILNLLKLAIICLAAKHAFLVAGTRDFRMMPLASRSRFALDQLSKAMELA